MMKKALVFAAAITASMLMLPVLAQDSAASEEEGKATSVPVPGTPVVSPEATRTIEQIAREQEEMITGRRFTYDPGGRRDPFLSLLEVVRRQRGKPLKGIMGMSISEVDLVGVVANPNGNIAFFNGSDNKGYFLKVGDEMFDGRLIEIDVNRGAVTLRQRVDDPRQIKPYRDITKRLVPLEEEVVQ
jgi:hypothetical protein